MKKLIKKSKNCKLIGTFIPNPGLSEQRAHIILADVINKNFILTEDDKEKILKIEFYKKKQIIKMIKENKIFDSFSLSAKVKSLQD